MNENQKIKIMKNIIVLFLPLFMLTTAAEAQNKKAKKYTAGMEKAFELWESDKASEAVSMFERIAQVEKKKWQPMYYAANVLISESFGAKDKTQAMLMLEQAKTFIQSANERSENNSEILTLEGLLYTGYVAMDPQTYAMQYSNKIMNLHNKAIKLNPENPRAHANMIEYEMGTAKFFKQDLTPFCERLQNILPKFDAQEKGDFVPVYGKERVVKIIEDCGQQAEKKS